MTKSTRETVLQALFTTLNAGKPSGAVCERNTSLPGRIPAAGVMILRDGDPGEPDVTLSPLTYHYEHRAEVDCLVDRVPSARDGAFDTLVRAVGSAIAADRTLGGLCDWMEGFAPAPLSIVIEGAEDLKAATVVVVLHYTSTDPLL